MFTCWKWYNVNGFIWKSVKILNSMTQNYVYDIVRILHIEMKLHKNHCDRYNCDVIENVLKMMEYGRRSTPLQSWEINIWIRLFCWNESQKKTENILLLFDEIESVNRRNGKRNIEWKTNPTFL